MSTTEGWLRLAKAVKDRRADRAWTQLDVHVQGGPSIDRIQAIEGARADGYSSRTLRKLESGLRWEPGSVQVILSGGEPTPTDHPPVPPAEEKQPEAEEIKEIKDQLDAMERKLEAMERRFNRQQDEKDDQRGRDVV